MSIEGISLNITKMKGFNYISLGSQHFNWLCHQIVCKTQLESIRVYEVLRKMGFNVEPINTHHKTVSYIASYYRKHYVSNSYSESSIEYKSRNFETISTQVFIDRVIKCIIANSNIGKDTFFKSDDSGVMYVLKSKNFVYDIKKNKAYFSTNASPFPLIKDFELNANLMSVRTFDEMIGAVNFRYNTNDLIIGVNNPKSLWSLIFKTKKIKVFSLPEVSKLKTHKYLPAIVTEKGDCVFYDGEWAKPLDKKTPIVYNPTIKSKPKVKINKLKFKKKQ